MNDLTKKELECLENAIHLQLSEKSMSQINYDRRVGLRDKLQSMIDNYCEHSKRQYYEHVAVYECEHCHMVSMI